MKKGHHFESVPFLRLQTIVSRDATRSFSIGYVGGENLFYRALVTNIVFEMSSGRRICREVLQNGASISGYNGNTLKRNKAGHFGEHFAFSRLKF